jgi:thiamine-phosphate pyrophosphorylase
VGVAFRCLLITDGYDAATPERVAAALSSLPAGFAAVQLRAKALTARELLAAAQSLGHVTRSHAAPLLINDRVDVALAAGADGVHLPARGLTAAEARELGARIVGVSTHSAAEVAAAEAAGADYVVFGPIFFTPSKAQYGAPLGLEALAAATRAAKIPLFALGGVDAENAGECVARGARVACVGAVLGQAETAAAARRLADALQRST